MPELPEVEMIRLGLEKYLVGHTIEKIEIRMSKLFRGEVEQVKGAKVQGVRRRGKGLLIDLNNEYTIAAHVKMTGQFIYKKLPQISRVPRVSQVGEHAALIRSFHPKLSLPVNLPNQYTHVIFVLDKATLFYNDIRQFGWLQVIKTADALALPFFQGLGPEPFVDLDLSTFQQIIRKGNLPIKLVLMDQKRMAGIGNIYANDALWLAKIDPRRIAKTLSKKEIEELYKAVLFVLSEGLKYGGASETNFFHVDGGKGDYQNHFLVYGKTGQACTRCGSLVKRIVIGGRGTFVCLVCQH